MNDIHYKLESFEGPLHLLLEMIESERLPLSEVSLSQVTDQFLRYVEEADRVRARSAEDGERRVDAETLVDFLVVASRLLYLKSKYVLDSLAVPEDEDGVSLEKQLALFKIYQGASKRLAEMVVSRSPAFTRSHLLSRGGAEAKRFWEPRGVDGETLSAAFAGVLSRLRFVAPRREAAYAKAVSLREKIERIRQMLQTVQRVSFSLLVGEAASKTEVVVSFLALLEMAKQRLVVVEQEEMFEEISVRRVSSV